MSRNQTIVGAIGLAVLAIAFIGVGRIVSTGSIDRLVAAAGNDYLVVAGVAIGLLACSIPVLLSGRTAALNQATMPEPEVPVTGTPPGRHLDEATGRLRTALPVVGRPHRRVVRGRLREATIRTLVRTGGYDRTTAVELVDSGDWTADPVAAHMVATPDRDVWPWIGLAATPLRNRSWFERRVERTVDAISRTARDRGAQGPRSRERSEARRRRVEADD